MYNIIDIYKDYQTVLYMVDIYKNNFKNKLLIIYKQLNIQYNLILDYINVGEIFLLRIDNNILTNKYLLLLVYSSENNTISFNTIKSGLAKLVTMTSQMNWSNIYFPKLLSDSLTNKQNTELKEYYFSNVKKYF